MIITKYCRTKSSIHFSKSTLSWQNAEINDLVVHTYDAAVKKRLQAQCIIQHLTNQAEFSIQICRKLPL